MTQNFGSSVQRSLLSKLMSQFWPEGSLPNEFQPTVALSQLPLNSFTKYLSTQLLFSDKQMLASLAAEVLDFRFKELNKNEQQGLIRDICSELDLQLNRVVAHPSIAIRFITNHFSKDWILDGPWTKLALIVQYYVEVIKMPLDRAVLAFIDEVLQLWCVVGIPQIPPIYNDLPESKFSVLFDCCYAYPPLPHYISCSVLRLLNKEKEKHLSDLLPLLEKVSHDAGKPFENNKRHNFLSFILQTMRTSRQEDLPSVSEQSQSFSQMNSLIQTNYWTVIRKWMLVTLRVISIANCNVDSLKMNFLTVLSILQTLLHQCESKEEALAVCLQDDDSHLIRALQLCLDIEPNDLFLNKHTLFVCLMTVIRFDRHLLLDWLLSPETDCLTYLVTYLRLFRRQFFDKPTVFIQSNSSLLIEYTRAADSQSGEALPLSQLLYSGNATAIDRLMKRLKRSLSKLNQNPDNLPYNPEPLLRSIDLYLHLLNDLFIIVSHAE